jgi:hypothetical protein
MRERNPTTAQDHDAARATVLRILRMAMLAGVFVFGSVIWFLHGQGSIETVPLDALLRNLFVGVMIAAAAGLMVVQRRHAAAADPQQVQTWTIVGWAVGEGVTLFGAVLYFLTGSITPFLVGVGMLLVAFIMIPVRGSRD